ncbi:MAG: hypothetical protein WA137_06970, partial [Methanothrix sp.]
MPLPKYEKIGRDGLKRAMSNLAFLERYSLPCALSVHHPSPIPEYHDHILSILYVLERIAIHCQQICSAPRFNSTDAARS